MNGIEQNCYCGKTLDYPHCCGLIHSGKSVAITAEDLMRSRYSAFVQANVDYILATYASETRPVEERDDILKWTQSVDWLGLEILKTEKGEVNDSEGWVEFKASFKEEGQKRIMHERSLFEKENGCWVYVSGEYPKKEAENKLLNRNDLCFCGSGKKFKKCCFNK